MDQALAGALASIYESVDRETAAFTCRACGRCCDFDNVDFVLFVSAIELDYLLSHVKGGFSFTGNTCPFQLEGKCTVRDVRPLGCRVYFCSLKDDVRMQDLYNTYFARIKELADRHNRAWRYMPMLAELARLSGSPLQQDR